MNDQKKTQPMRVEQTIKYGTAIAGRTSFSSTRELKESLISHQGEGVTPFGFLLNGEPHDGPINAPARTPMTVEWSYDGTIPEGKSKGDEGAIVFEFS